MIKKVIPLNLKDAFVIEPNIYTDSRGHFVETFSLQELNEYTDNIWVQDNMSLSKKSGTFRGFHYQLPPYTQAKLVRVMSGEVIDFIIDLRGKSPTFKKSTMVMLTESKMNMLYVPAGFAHAFLTLTDNVIFEYKVSNYYNRAKSRNIRFDDRSFDISIPYDLDTMSFSMDDMGQTHFDSKENPFEDWE